MLYVNGDSWSFGVYKNNGDKNAHIWPNLLAKELKLEIINDSMGCSSNSRILSSTENFYINSGKPKLIILALTGHNRLHLPGPGMSSWLVGADFVINDFTGHRDPENKLCPWIVKYSYDELDSVYRYYKTVWNLHELCLKFNCMYIMLQAWDSELEKFGLLKDTESIERFVWDRSKNIDEYISEKYINGFKFFKEESEKWHYKEQQTFRSVLLPDNYDDTEHPNDRGHELITNYVLNAITELRKYL